MGDGRYYTYYQFFNIVLVTFLTMLAVASATYSYYRLSDKRSRRHAYTIFSLIVIFAVLHVAEGLIPHLIYAKVLRNMKGSLMIALMSSYVMHSIFIWQGLTHKIKVKRYNLLKKIVLRSYKVGVFLLIISGMLIKDYKFHNVNYSPIYKGIILVLLVTYVFFNVIVMTIQSRRYGFEVKGNKIHVNIMILKFLLISPLFFYIIALFKDNMSLDFIEILIGFSYTFLLNLELYTYDEAGITLHAFDKMGDMSLDCIFVTDMSGKILYRNKSSRHSNFFKPVEVVEKQHIQTLFHDEIVIKSNHMGKEYIVLKHNAHKHYFAFKSVTLKEHSKSIGYIITITEITLLINLLHELEERREVSKAVNQKLKNQALVVYRLEKEKEISALLEEIINSRETQMNVLSQMIDRTKLNIDLPTFESDIEEAIQKSNLILEDVRKTVSTYRAYYGNDLLT